MLDLLLPFQRFFIPGLIVLLAWSSYRTVFKKDRAVGLALYISLVIIVDTFFNTGIYIPGLAKGSIRYSELCAFLLIFSNPPIKGTVKKNNLVALMILIYFLLFAFSALRGITLESGIFNFRRLIVPQIVTFLVVQRGFEKREDYERFLFYFMTLLLIISIFTFWDLFFDRWLLKSESLYTATYGSSRRQGRFGSIFMNPNYLGGFIVLVFPVIFVRALMEKKHLWKKIYCWAAVFGIVFALVETQSRGPFLGFVISLGVYFLIPSKRFPFSKRIGMLFLFLVVFYIFMPGFFKHATERFIYVDEEMSEEHISRKVTWMFTLDLIRHYPVFGIGLGEPQYIQKMSDFGFKEEYLTKPLDNAHNSYLQIAVHAGVPAFLMFMIFNTLIIKQGVFRAIRSGTQDFSFYAAGLAAGLIGFLACIYVDMQMFTMSVAPAYWMFFGLLYSLVINRRQLFQDQSFHSNIT